MAGKKYRDAVAKTDRFQEYDLVDAVEKIREITQVKFDATIDIAMKLGVDPRHADQVVRGTVMLPHGTGKTVSVLVVCKEAKAEEAVAAGADFVGFEEYVEKIQNGWTGVDVIIATPDVMGQLGKVAKILGPRGLMPNPKSGTVTMDVAKAVKEVKAGKIEFRVDKAGNVHAPVGKVSFQSEQLVENITSFLKEVVRLKPSAAKGQYVQGIALSSTMSPSVKVKREKFVA
ncbi:50S ribosomal protein L1 [Chlorobium phaeobacteroides]|jgi:large subunit ribosomal protein L1|uniref:Large ribosomal subunit protein uL1 n=1 Tax=Chlorobium phaeobacteroides (strain DSM 266 / SMG 266 / 2430) TaxID=290317 RepID=RL1_CHLPD|nr:50S ribosomal protein L1 [Chlorobium phaeobacteroides]A1BD20.1 RecName: Full=Large ribosomal subunit protein uL1; AltName: Full=50S ribosomal protein L1 [Chlorobium phaeobacteroides DSM 266]ABL64297.1 LSU ribosomal protein L1P [Chlorobium phaeobacteroides DSM 266]MBV5328031.1 50S ribosomal protein L1 [Chlorobium sp.]